VRIVCLLKQVPHPAAIEFDQETKALRREGVPLLLNPFDAYAVEHAVGLRDAFDGEVVAMTMGPPQAEDALRQALALGADRAVHLSDRVFALADTIGTARTLALALAHEGPDLVLCGLKTIDAETWQVPPEVAAFLGWPHLIGAVSVEAAGEGIRAVRETDEGSETFEVALPAVVSVAVAPGPLELPDPLGGDVPITVKAATDLVDEVYEYEHRFGQTGSPTRVLAVRDVRPARAGARARDGAEAARLVRERLQEVDESGASEWDKPERLGEQPGRSYDFWTVVEPIAGRAARVSLELLGKGRELSGMLGGRNVALVLGHRVGASVEQAARYGAELVLVVDDERLAPYHPEIWSAALRQVVERRRPHALAIPATAYGRDYGPRVAGELELGMTGDCVNLGIDRAGRLIQTKPAYGGAIVSVIMGSTTPQLATVRARSFQPVAPRPEARADVEEIRLDRLPAPRLRLVERRLDSPAYELDEAGTVVCAGAEAGGFDGVARIAQLAVRLGATVGGDREACERGWLPRNRQIGLYGRALAPRLYLAVGVSGGWEHDAGPMRAGVIAALSADPSAEILGGCDVGLVGDWRETLPAFVDAFARS
jgi:electron transfer flavoprotein alpha subunit